MFQGLYQYRGFIWRQAVADLRHRYAGTGMGLAWNVVHPLGVIAVYSIVFSTIMKTRIEGLPEKFGYTIFLCAGLFPWMAFSDCIVRGCNAFVANASYLKKLPIPEQVFVAHNAVTTALSLAINFTLVLILSTSLGLQPHWAWFLLPVPLALLVVLGFGVGLLLGTLNVFFRDVGEWVALFLPIIFWTVPIVYQADILPPMLKSLLLWHPIGPPVLAVQSLVLKGQIPTPEMWLRIVAWPVLMLVVGLATFRALKPEIRDLV